MRETRIKQNKNSGNGTKILVIILVILIIVAATLFAMKVWNDKQNGGETVSSIQEGDSVAENTIKEKQTPKTFAGNERAIAFMIDNNINAMPQAGLLEADLVYEIIVEGGETRLMAVIKNKELEKIGPLRSARHYFLDYALENDAIYVHYGQSPQAKSDIVTLGISDINGINESESYFWRVSSRYAPHNAVTSTAQIQKIIEREGFRTTSNKGSVLNYVAEEIELEAEIDEAEVGNTVENTASENTQTEQNTNKIQANDSSQLTNIKNLANTVTIPYSSYNTVKYTYDEETKTYIRYSRNKKQTDWDTDQTVTTKNIIITKCKNTSIDSYGRQTIDNIKTLDGYYITNGKYIPITCEKTSRSGKTVYKDLDGNEIKVNDGKTFIQICPIDSKITFE